MIAPMCDDCGHDPMTKLTMSPGWLCGPCGHIQPSPEPVRPRGHVFRGVILCVLLLGAGVAFVVAVLP